MADFPGRNYAPPGTYTQTSFENPLAGALESLRLPVFVGEGDEDLYQTNLAIVRGSSRTVDQQVTQEDETGRAVASVSQTGVVTLGAWNGSLTKFQVRNFPIVTGDGTGTTATDRGSVSVTINGLPVVVLSVTGSSGIVEMSQAPDPGDTVRCTHFFNRTDTLTTDDVSEQVTSTSAQLWAAVGVTTGTAGYTVTANNNTFSVYVDAIGISGNVGAQTASTITLPTGTRTALELANSINAAAIGTLVASVYINNHGQDSILLTADQYIKIGSGNANGLLGFAPNEETARQKVFYTFQGPIVDGSNGGITTTSTAAVTVMVDNTQVIPISVAGASRAVTLATAPAAGATVTIQYYFNTWQDTFDLLMNIGITDVTRCGITPDRNDYVDGTDFVLKNDTIVWGTASLVSSGVHTTGKDYFGSDQITTTLVDNRIYMAACTRVTNTVFQLPYQPTVGNGRNTPVGNGSSSLFQTVTNSRIDLPSNRPDTIIAFWGYSVQDAWQRFVDNGGLTTGQGITVTEVEHTTSRITLADEIPVGASVYATFYYNTLTDEEYTLTCALDGVSGVGTYTMQDDGNNDIHSAVYDSGSKGAGLTGVTIEFPEGETNPDLIWNAGTPVEEVVTVQFESQAATPAAYTVPDAGPYYTIENQSDKLRVLMNGNTNSPIGAAAGIDLSAPCPAAGYGISASHMGDEIAYDAAASGTTWTIDSTENTVVLTLDDVELTTQCDTGASKTVADFVTRINEGAMASASTLVAAINIQSTSAANPAVIETAVAHGLAVGDSVFIAGATIVALNGQQVVTGVGDTTHFTIAVNGGAGGGAVGTVSYQTTVGLKLPTTTSNVDDYYNGWQVVPTAGAASGDIATITDYDGTRRVATIGAGLSAVPGVVAYYLVNPNTRPEYKGSGAFNTSFTVEAAANNRYDQLSFRYVSTGNTIATQTITIAAGTYASATALATQIQTQLDLNALINDATNYVLPWIWCVANADGNLVFSFRGDARDVATGGGYFEFIENAVGNRDFALMAGLDVDASGGSQVKALDGNVARRFTIAGTPLLHDRLVLRNRLLVGLGEYSWSTMGRMSAHNAIAQSEIDVGAGTANTILGLSNSDYIQATNIAAVKTASLYTSIGLSGGQNDGSVIATARGEADVTFYSGTGASPANNVLELTIDGTPVTVTFTATATGTVTPLGSTSAANNTAAFDAASVLGQIEAALAAVPGAPFGAIAAVQAAQYVRRDGLGLRLSSALTTTASNVTIGTGSANATLNFSDGETASRIAVQPEEIASALMFHNGATLVAVLFSGFLSPTANYFCAEGVAGVELDALNNEYLFIQSDTSGASSSLVFNAATLENCWRHGTGLDVIAGTIATGEAGINGFFVISSNPSGSGSANTSVFNAGTGQDGVVGQTYLDAETGLTFTILNRTGNIAYPTGATATFRINVSKTFTSDANAPTRAIPGVEMYVANTYNVGVADTGVVETFERSGNEPTVGDLYYATYVYTKQDFSLAFWTKMSSIEAAYGTTGPEAPVSLASYLAILNGAVLVGIKQVQKATDSAYASLTSYRDAIDSLATPVRGNITPDTITLLRGDSTSLYEYLDRHVDIQSSIRYKKERTGLIGVSSGTDEDAVGLLAQTLGNTRMRIVYPDLAVLSLEDAQGTVREYLVDGCMIASAMSGNRASPNIDVATPWTNGRLVGFTQLGRTLDAVEQNQVAVQGVTVMEDQPPFLKVRHGLTTDMSTILTKLPTIIQIADEVQRQTRSVLDQFIGIKFLPIVKGQIDGRVAAMFKSLIKAQIVAAYTGISTTIDPNDPTTAEVQGYYAPIFPLLYLICSYHLRGQLA
jgi:hypothetical protein